MSYTSDPGFSIGRAVVGAAVFVLFGALNLAAQGDQAFKGKITNCMCSGPAEHTVTLEKSATTEACAVACVKNGANFVLSDSDNRTVYQLDNQRKPRAFAGENVVVIGTLDETSHTIHVSEMFRALPP